MVACSAISCDSTCIEFRHSGGVGNSNPCMDLGGDMSNSTISVGINNLFHSIGPELSREGHIDYRCFYITNTAAVAILRNVNIYLGGTGIGTPGKAGGTFAKLGVKLENASQNVVVAGTEPPNDGDYFQVTVPGYAPFNVYYDQNVTKWVGNFQSAIRTIDGLQGTIVTSMGDVPNVTFYVNFVGQIKNHFLNLMTIVNSLTNCTVSVVSDKSGSPVNTTAVIIPDEITPPAGINFDNYFRGNPIKVGDLRPGDFVPIWVQRTLPIPAVSQGVLTRSGQMAKLEDYFAVVVDAISP